MRMSILGNDHLRTTASHYCLAQILAEFELDGAIEQYQAALDIQIKHYGNDQIIALTYVVCRHG
jgi:hypothetical protein